MIEVGSKVIVPTSDNEAVLCVVLVRYADNILRVAELSRKGVPLESKRWFVKEADVTPTV